MTHRYLHLAIILSLGVAACTPQEAEETPPESTDAIAASDDLIMPGEVHFANMRQLTNGGDNAEAYWAFDGSMLLFQHRPTTAECDQIYSLDPVTGEKALLSTGDGRTTCSYFYPSGDKILYSSTHHHDASCPAPPDMSLGYVWPLNDTYDVFVANADGSDLQQLTDVMGYDAEATISPTGDRIVFTSARDGDLELYSMALDGSDLVRLTNRVGYDGGAFYSPDGTKIIWRAHYPEEGEAKDDYLRLLAEGLIRPGELEIWVMNADGTDAHPVTDIGGANFGPFWHPSGEKVIFSTNHQDPSGRDFELFMVNLDGTGLEQITFSGGFDGFPVWSPDGSQIVFGSNRNNGGTNDTNVFIADWIEDPGM